MSLRTESSSGIMVCTSNGKTTCTAVSFCIICLLILFHSSYTIQLKRSCSHELLLFFDAFVQQPPVFHPIDKSYQIDKKQIFDYRFRKNI